MLGRKRPSVVEPRRPPPRPASALRFPPVMVFRMFVLGSVAVVASIWAIWHHYTTPRTPMLVPAPSASEIEIEVPQ